MHTFVDSTKRMKNSFSSFSLLEIQELWVYAGKTWVSRILRLKDIASILGLKDALANIDD